MRKSYTLTLLVDEALLRQSYISNQGINELDCPDNEEMVLSELNWICQIYQPQIDVYGNINDICQTCGTEH